MTKKKSSGAASPTPAAERLSKALLSFDADGARAALAAGADPNRYLKKNSPPLNIVLAMRSPLLKKRDKPRLSAERQLALLRVLLEAKGNWF